MSDPDDIVDSILKLKKFMDEGDKSCKDELVLQLTLLKYKTGQRFDDLPWFADLLKDLTKKEKESKDK